MTRLAVERRRIPYGESPRRYWQNFVDSARRLASIADGASFEAVVVAQRAGVLRGSPAERLTDFAHLTHAARHVDFPVAGASPALMVEGFLKIGRAFAEAGLPQYRTAYAPALAAAADALDSLLSADVAASAERGRRMMGERDDD
jgi:hypothetical protein